MSKNINADIIKKLSTAQQVRLAMLMRNEGLDLFTALTAVVMEAS